MSDQLTVSDVIKILQSLPGDAIVVYPDIYNSCYYAVKEVGTGIIVPGKGYYEDSKMSLRELLTTSIKAIILK